MTEETIVIFDAGIVEVLSVLSLFLVAVIGAIITYQAYRGAKRNDSTSMFYLAIGLLFLTVVPFLLNVTLTTLLPVMQVETVFAQNVSRLAGLLAIFYSLYGTR